MSNVESLARDWLEAKEAEAEAQQRRWEIEEQLTAALDAKDEGSITYKFSGYKVTLTQPVSRKVDSASWDQVRHLCPPDMQPVKTKIEPDAKGMKWLANNEPAIWSKIAPAFESRKGKVGVKVETIETEKE